VRHHCPCSSTSPVVNHAYSSLILSEAGPPSSPIVDLGHWIRVLRSADFTWSRPVVDLLSQIHWASPLRRQATHSTMTPQIHRATRSPPPRLTSYMGGPTPWDVQPRELDLRHGHHLRGRHHCSEGRLLIHGRATAARHAALSAPMDPLRQPQPLTSMSTTPTPTPDDERGGQRRSIAHGATTPYS
jgi:hypothetical protein